MLGNVSMAKKAQIGLRVEPGIKAALEKAATKQNRSVANLLETIAREWLKANGYE